MIVNAWVCFSLGGYVYVLFIFVYVSALFKTSSNFWMHKGSPQLSSFPSARSSLDTEGVWLPQRLQAPIFMNQRTGTGQQDRMGHQFPHCRKHMEERLLAHKLHWWWCRHRIRVPKSWSGWGLLCANPSHHLALQAMVPLFEFILFLFIYKYLFSFPHKIGMTDPARAGILQVKSG